MFRDRTEAGRTLAYQLSKYKNNPDVLVLALPRGGVPVAFEVASELNAALDIFVVRKLGVPGYEELAMGAIASGGALVLNNAVIRDLDISQETIADVTRREREELQRRETLYRAGRMPLGIAGKIVILVDDGLATGSSMKAAVAAVRQENARQVIAAVPVGPQDICSELKRDADEVVCTVIPKGFHAVGIWYDDFTQTTDAQVQDLMRRAA